MRQGQALAEILKASAAVNEQIQEISTGVGEVRAACDGMVKAVDNVNGIVEENTAATEQMAANSTQVTKAIESIAAISEENSSATQEVSVAAKEMSAQVAEAVASAQSLAQVADDLRSSVAHFKVDEREDESGAVMRHRKTDWEEPKNDWLRARGACADGGGLFTSLGGKSKAGALTTRGIRYIVDGRLEMVGAKKRGSRAIASVTPAPPGHWPPVRTSPASATALATPR